jgi:hypothetical protein
LVTYSWDDTPTSRFIVHKWLLPGKFIPTCRTVFLVSIRSITDLGSDGA